MINNISKNTLNDILKTLKQENIEKIVVGAVIVMGKNTTLLLKRRSDDFAGGLIELPSGTVEKGESLIDALVREIKEETGLTILSIDNYIGSFDYLSASKKQTRQLNFKITPKNKDVILSNEHSDFYILEPENHLFNTLNISAETKKIIQSAFK